jgi:polar amino acid transport system substrate-binding protein
MPRLRPILAALLVIALAATLAACGDDDDAQDAAGTVAVTVSSEACSKDALDLVKDGVLTVGTDEPAFPPYFEDDDPTNGRGFESAVAYAIADELGFAPTEVEWTVVPFNASFAPGPKRFDFDINQISITPPRAEQVDFSVPYYTTQQAVVVFKGSEYEDATTFEELRGATFGVQVGTTSLDALTEIIQPSGDPQVFNDSNDLVRALRSRSVDAAVFDTPTAFYLTGAVIPNAATIGEFSAPGGDDWGVVLQRGSALTPCVDQAIESLRASGELDDITATWMGAEAGIPKLS